MMCEGCGNQRAQIAFHVIFGGKKVVRNYCPRCAQMLRRGDAVSIQLAVVNALSDEQIAQAAPCPVCGMTVESLQKSGRVGCSACYRAFSPVMDVVFNKLGGMQGQSSDKIKEENLLSETQKHIQSLRNELAQAVSAEDYERAAQLRDEINALLQEEKQA